MKSTHTSSSKSASSQNDENSPLFQTIFPRGLHMFNHTIGHHTSTQYPRLLRRVGHLVHKHRSIITSTNERVDSFPHVVQQDHAFLLQISEISNVLSHSQPHIHALFLSWHACLESSDPKYEQHIHLQCQQQNDPTIFQRIGYSPTVTSCERLHLPNTHIFLSSTLTSILPISYGNTLTSPHHAPLLFERVRSERSWMTKYSVVHTIHAHRDSQWDQYTTYQ